MARNKIGRLALRGLSRTLSRTLPRALLRQLGWAGLSLLLCILPVGSGQAQVVPPSQIPAAASGSATVGQAAIGQTVDQETTGPETVDPETIDPETIDPETSGAAAVAQKTVPLVNQASYRYSDPFSNQRLAGATNGLETEDLLVIPVPRTATPLVDPLGQLLGCGGQPLPSYSDFSMALYELNPADPTGTELGALVELTPTEAEERLGNGVAAGLAPNLLNRNPFPLSSSGRYNFLFDPSRGQTEPGQSYILVIRPPNNSIYPERRIKLVLKAARDSNSPLSYRAIALDGEPISLAGSNQIAQTSVQVAHAETTGLNLSSIQFPLVLCPAEPLTITKTASQATAEPGDTVIYRVTLRSQSEVPLTALRFTDVLPQGLQLIENSVQAEMDGRSIAVTTSFGQRANLVPGEQPSTVFIQTPVPLLPQGIINLLYAVRISPDALRGSGRNSVTATSRRQDNQFVAQAGPALHGLQIRPGITSDCGVLLGRVFEDLNLDGEQQRGEPGIANAVIYLQDGNRVVTDGHGLFSVANVLPGSYTGVLDLSSVPGYDFAPNHNRRAFRSGSRLVRLAPSSMARMNFPVVSLTEEAE